MYSVVLLVALTLGLLAYTQPIPELSAQPRPRPLAAWVGMSGQYVSKITFNPYDEMRLSIIVPNDTSPVSVQAVINGKWDKPFSWDVNVTGYGYIIDLGQAFTVAAMPGDYSVYAVVTFSDGIKSASNNVRARITGVYIFYDLQGVLTLTDDSEKITGPEQANSIYAGRRIISIV